MEKCKIWDNQEKQWFKPEYPGTKTDLKSGKRVDTKLTREILFSMSGEMYMYEAGEQSKLEHIPVIKEDDQDTCRFVVCYYSGIKDINDKKAYVNDSVKCDGKEGVIFFSHGSFKIKWLGERETGWANYLANHQFEITGNILEYKAKLEATMNEKS